MHAQRCCQASSASKCSLASVDRICQKLPVPAKQIVDQTKHSLRVDQVLLLLLCRIVRSVNRRSCLICRELNQRWPVFRPNRMDPTPHGAICELRTPDLDFKIQDRRLCGCMRRNVSISNTDRRDSMYCICCFVRIASPSLERSTLDRFSCMRGDEWKDFQSMPINAGHMEREHMRARMRTAMLLSSYVLMCAALSRLGVLVQRCGHWWVLSRYKIRVVDVTKVVI